jgi:RHS repeat-associated protein
LVCLLPRTQGSRARRNQFDCRQTHPYKDIALSLGSSSLGLPNEGGIPDENAFYMPFGYAGEQRDPESGLTYLRARYMDPASGRFISRDSFAGYAGSSQSQNRYAYANGNSVNLTDPTGRCPLCWALVQGVLIVASVIATAQDAVELHETLNDDTISDSEKYAASSAFAFGVLSSISCRCGFGKRFLPINPKYLDRHIEMRKTLDRIQQKSPKHFNRDGTPKHGSRFENREGRLPRNNDPDYYQEWTVDSPWDPIGRGDRRIVVGKGGEYYYTDQHYKSFMRFSPW